MSRPFPLVHKMIRSRSALISSLLWCGLGVLPPPAALAGPLDRPAAERLQGSPLATARKPPVARFRGIPFISALELTPGATVQRPIELKATLTSPKGLKRVTITFQGKTITRELGGKKTAALSETLTAAKAGNQQVVIEAIDNEGTKLSHIEIITVAEPGKQPTIASKVGPARAAVLADKLRGIKAGAINGSGEPAATSKIDLTLGDCVIKCSTPYLGYYPPDGCNGGYTTALHFGVYSSLKNSGSEAAIFDQGWRVYSNGTIAYLAPAGGLYIAAGDEFSGYDSYTPRISTGTLAPGIHEFTFVVDPDNRIAESNEDNNTKTCSLEVVPAAGGAAPPQADLTVTSVSVTPSSGPPSTRFKFTAVVANKGTADVTGSISVDCSPGGLGSITDLGAGKSKTVESTVNYPMPPGNKTVTCTADSAKRHEESDETNNSLSKAFTVTN